MSAARDVVIRTEGLGKCYRLGERGTAHSTLRDALAGGVSDASRRMLAVLRGRQRAPRRELIWALRDLSLEIRSGEVVGVIGRNGAGKTTLLKILSRITRPSAGRVELWGRVGSLLEVGTGFHPELSGRENIYLNGAILGMRTTEIARRFDEIVAFAEVERFLDTPVKRYSSGMYVRLAFAVAAHMEPEILLVDEVLAVGDIAFQRKCLGKMGEVARGGRTVLFVSHNMAAVRNLCTAAVVLEDGRVALSGSVAEVIARYVSGLSDPRSGGEGPVAWNPETGLRVERCELEDGRNEVVAALEAGSPGSICLRITAAQALQDVLVSMGISSEEDVRLTVVHSKIAGAEIRLPAGASTIRCRLPRVTLRPGLYRVSLKLYSGAETLIWEPHAFDFQIIEGDFFGTGKLPLEWGGVCLIEQSWKIEPQSTVRTGRGAEGC